MSTVDLKLIEPVLDEYAGIKGSLITILFNSRNYCIINQRR